MDDGFGWQYPNGDYYEYSTAIMYYADGSTEHTIYPPAFDDSGNTGIVPSDPALVTQAQSAAEQGTLDKFTEGLMKLGTTAAQLAMLYQNVQSSRQLTPVALQNLQQERAYLQTQTQSSQTMWMWVALAAGAGLVLLRSRSAN